MIGRIDMLETFSFAKEPSPPSGKIYICNIQIIVNLNFYNEMLPGCIQEYR